MTATKKPKRYQETKADALRAAREFMARLPGNGWVPKVGTNTGRGGWYWYVRLGCLSLYENVAPDGCVSYGCLLAADEGSVGGGAQFWTPGDEYCGAPLKYETPEEAIAAQMAAARAFVARVTRVVAEVDSLLLA